MAYHEHTVSTPSLSCHSQLLDLHGIEPPTRTHFAKGEELVAGSSKTANHSPTSQPVKAARGMMGLDAKRFKTVLNEACMHVIFTFACTFSGVV